MVFLVQVKFQSTEKEIWLTERELMKFIRKVPGCSWEKLQQTARQSFAAFIALTPESDGIIRYARSRVRGQEVADNVFYESQLVANTIPFKVLQSETVADKIDMMKQRAAKFNSRIPKSEKVIIMPISNAHDVSAGDYNGFKKQSGGYDKNRMKLLIFQSPNEEFKQDRYIEARLAVTTTQVEFNTSNTNFHNAEANFNNNKNIWKQEKQYKLVRDARWNRDEKRKLMTRCKKTATTARTKMNNLYKQRKFTSSEAQQKAEDTEFMLKLMKRPYEKTVGEVPIFKMLNEREDERKRLKLVELERKLRLRPLSKRKEFR